MTTNARRKRHRILAWVAALTVAGVVLLVIAIAVVWLRRPQSSPSAVPPGVLPPSSTSTHPHKPRPSSQDASCPDVQLIAIPGTWESSPQDDPLNPMQFPNALLRKVTGPISQQFPSSRVQTYTVAYTAQFHNPLSGDTQMSYNDSRAEGTRAAVQALTDMNDKCPLTSYVLTGFSQGAVIAGDIASDIGNGRGPIDDDLVLGVTLIADGRRQPGVGNDVGPNPPGQGAEVTLQEVPMLSGLGLTMTGARPGGFGALNGKTNEICAPGDLICAAPDEAFSVANLPTTLNTLAGGAGQPVHALYATTQFWNVDGVPATDWTLNWAHGLIENAPRPKHG
ncbi:cutinase family protein [Mycobacterium malmoense]|uniref:Cutinase n=1 Tax=Mycobacterium malmoense TaxID=1780 RepID=A0ABX3SLR5_MYCMA|nr:cutinase family protein [Mycobacterium malmoense]OIN80184.1 cutinase [Mycobacterium malmoense]ORA78651.1 cutinase [Mycobacterium malmoense]QZA17600.1 cutinase family protein [Mycobacterium malmoense]UNB94383.1 cutinase family protein [Mycobacterium malmoense]